MTKSPMDELQRLGQEWEAGVTDTERLRRLARDSNDGNLRGPALMAADTIEAMTDTITKLRAEVAELRKQLEPKITPALEPSFDDDDAALGEGER